jgi:hypothetical protein
MMADDPNLKPHYRMPRVFGALPGPRNVPKDKQHLPNNQTSTLVSVTALTDAALLAQLLPPDCDLDGEPLITVTGTYLENIGWLGGHGYNILSVNFRIAHESKSQGRLVGGFTPVLWENLADPILTGREELGFAKLFADIPMPRALGGGYTCQAGWGGFRFFDMTVEDLVGASLDLPAPTIGQFHYKFIPTTGAQDRTDVGYLEYAPPGLMVTGYGGLVPTSRKVGTGRLRFHHARWEDVPFQYPILNALADLPIHEVRAASVMTMAAGGPIGDVSAGVLRAVD